MGLTHSRNSAAAIERCARHREQLELLLDALDEEAAAIAAFAVHDIHCQIERVRRRETALARAVLAPGTPRAAPPDAKRRLEGRW